MKTSLTILLATAILLSPALAETIRVIDAETGRVLPDVSVQYGGRLTVTDSTGAVRFESLPDTLTLSRVGYRTLVSTVPHANPIILSPVLLPLDTLDVVGQSVQDDRSAREPAFTTVVERAAFAEDVTSLPDVLDRSAGIQVQSLGGAGTFSTISVRGASSEQVEVYLDDILLNAAVGGGVNLSNLPLANVDRIEINRGGGQTGNGLGGTVHIQTRAQDTGRTEVAASLGSFDTRGLTVFSSHGTNNLRGLAVVDYLSTDNDFDFLDDNGTEYNLDDDHVVPRANNDVQTVSFLGKGTLDLDDRRSLSASQTVLHKRQGIPGISNNQSIDARLEALRATTQINFEHRSPDWGSTLQTLYLSQINESFIDTLGEIGVGRQDNDYRTRSYGHRSRTRFLLPHGNLLTLGTELRRETYDPTASIQLITPLFASRRWTTQLRAALERTLLSDRVSLTGSVDYRHQRNRFIGRNPFAFSPQAPDSVNTRNLFGWHSGARVLLTERLSLKGNVAGTERAPSFYELFGDRGSVVGNTTLNPETGTTWDLGARIDDSHLWIEAVYFEQRYDDLILFAQTSQSTSRPANVGSALVRGIETSGSVSLLEDLSVSGNYTLQESEDRSPIPHLNGNQLPGRPRHKAGLRTDISLGRIALIHDYTFEDGSYLDQANRRSVGARHIHSTSIRVRVGKSARIGFHIRNLTNTTASDVRGYPLPGRSMSFSLNNTW